MTAEAILMVEGIAAFDPEGEAGEQDQGQRQRREQQDQQNVEETLANNQIKAVDRGSGQGGFGRANSFYARAGARVHNG